MKKKVISLLAAASLAVVALAGCGSSSDSGSASAPAESAGSESAAEESAAAESGVNVISQDLMYSDPIEGPDYSSLKIGLMNSYINDDGGWCQATYEGVVAAMNDLGIPEENLISLESIDDFDQASTEAAAEQLIDEGCTLIIAGSTGYGAFLSDIVAAHPEVKFAQWGSKNEGMIGYMIRSYEGMFLAGYASELLSNAENKQLGFAASMDEFSVRTAINAYALGAKYADPEATVQVACADTWYDIDKETQAAQSLIDAGIKYMGMEASSPAVPETCQKNGAYVVGYHLDLSSLAPDAVLVSHTWNFAPIFRQIMISVCDGSATANDFYYWGGECSKLTDFASFVPEEVQTQVADAAAKIASGEIQVFGGELKDTNGNVLVAEGEVMADEDIVLQEFYVEGVNCAWAQNW